MSDNEKLSPFLKWAGGKEQELVHILPNIPQDFHRYLEPFVGGGAVYFAINKENMVINDKSRELINLYRMIKEGNQEFFCKIEGIYHNWKVLENIVDRHADLVISKYKDYSCDKITKSELDDFILEFILHHVDEFNGVLSTSFNLAIDNFIKEIKKNLISKTGRMKKIEAEKGKLPDSDIVDNFETAFKSAYYMHFRYLYNHIKELKISLPFAMAIFYFIREYCYASMFRYNKSGKFNVPYGGISYNRKDFAKKIEYLKSPKLQEYLRKTEIYNLDFEEFFEKVKVNKNDFIFLDPPYDTEFSDYVGLSFTSLDQKRLAGYLYQTEAKFLLVIKNTELIRELYFDKGFNVKAFDKKYLVSFQNRNDKTAEHLLITNY
ncbi:MAG: DNA adenine methylase [Clostridia bacterium]|nr:DNA adenine methylase [Clostridia bacterium]